MLFRMASDLKEFLVVMFIFLCMFVSIFYYRNYDLPTEEYGFHDDDPENPFYPLGHTLQTLYLLAFAGDFDADAFGGTESFVLLVRPAHAHHAACRLLPCTTDH